MMSFLMADKRRFFAAFGALGGVLSAIASNLLGFTDSAFESWVLGTASDGALIAALVAVGQSRYLGKKFDLAAIRRALAIGAIGGAIGGLVGMAGMSIAAGEFGRMAGWALGGAAVGFAVHRIIPNLPAKTAMLAGAAGGFAGCLSMYLVSYTIGVATTGAIIGLAIALVEMKVREMWLEVTIRPKGLTLEKERTVAVTLGTKPVVFGCSGDADVQLASAGGTEKDFVSVGLAGRQAYLKDHATQQSRPISDGEEFSISNASIILRSKIAEAT